MMEERKEKEERKKENGCHWKQEGNQEETEKGRCHDQDSDDSGHQMAHLCAGLSVS